MLPRHDDPGADDEAAPRNREVLLEEVDDALEHGGSV